MEKGRRRYLERGTSARLDDRPFQPGGFEGGQQVRLQMAENPNNITAVAEKVSIAKPLVMAFNTLWAQAARHWEIELWTEQDILDVVATTLNVADTGSGATGGLSVTGGPAPLPVGRQEG